ncbi:MAG TPA: hypothetical protein VFY89_07340, partial [Ktedonobacterales bacterium]
MSRPLFRFRYAAGGLMALGLLVLAACGGSSGSAAGSSTSVSGSGSDQQAQMIAQQVQQENL